MMKSHGLLLIIALSFSHAVEKKFEKAAIDHYLTLGKTDWGKFQNKLICPPHTNVAGFRIKVGALNAADRTGLDGIQLACTDGSKTNIVSSPYGRWEKWLFCDGDSIGMNYVVAFNYRSQKSQGYRTDDIAGANIKMNCSNNVELVGKGVDMGTWDRIEYVKCANGSAFCGVQPEIEPSGKVDNTAVNRLRFLCCKHDEDSCKDASAQVCKRWVANGYCTHTTAYIKEVCCKTCENHLKRIQHLKCDNQAEEKMCTVMAKEGKCSLPEYFPWALHICCKTCSETKAFKSLLKERNKPCCLELTMT